MNRNRSRSIQDLLLFVVIFNSLSDARFAVLQLSSLFTVWLPYTVIQIFFVKKTLMLHQAHRMWFILSFCVSQVNSYHTCLNEVRLFFLNDFEIPCYVKFLHSTVYSNFFSYFRINDSIQSCYFFRRPHFLHLNIVSPLLVSFF